MKQFTNRFRGNVRTDTKDAAGRFLSSFVAEADSEPLPETDRECGIDLSLGHFAAPDDDTKVAAPHFLRRAEKKLKRAQRDLSRKREGSANRKKARVKVARAHAKVTDARRDFHQKLSTVIVRKHRGDGRGPGGARAWPAPGLVGPVHDVGWVRRPAVGRRGAW